MYAPDVCLADGRAEFPIIFPAFLRSVQDLPLHCRTSVLCGVRRREGLDNHKSTAATTTIRTVSMQCYDIRRTSRPPLPFAVRLSPRVAAPLRASDNAVRAHWFFLGPGHRSRSVVRHVGARAVEVLANVSTDTVYCICREATGVNTSGRPPATITGGHS